MDKNDAPDIYYIMYRDVIVFDHFNNSMQIISLSDDSSILLDIWNQVDHQVRNILQHGLYKDTTIEKAIINDTFEGYDKL